MIIEMLGQDDIREELENGKLFKLNLDVLLKEKYLGMYYSQNNFNLALKEFIIIMGLA